MAHKPIRRDETAASPVRVIFEGKDATWTVDDAHVPVSLRPLLLGVWRPPGSGNDPTATLHFEDRATGMRVGRLALQSQGGFRAGEGELRFYAVKRTQNRCAAFLTLQLRYLLAWRHARRVEKSGLGFAMTAADLRALAVYYMHPRTVYLVCIEDGERSNVFPMDLVGPLPSGHFSMALRLTNPSVAVMKAQRRLTVSSIAAEHKDTILALGSNHGVANVDWATLPFGKATSPHLGLPYPDIAFRIRELEIEETQDIGSHCLFLTRQVAETKLGAPSPQLAYQSGLYVKWRGKKSS